MICTFPSCSCMDGCAARLWNERAVPAPCACCYCKDKAARARRERIREVVRAGQAGMPFPPPPPGRRVRDDVVPPAPKVPLSEQASVLASWAVARLNQPRAPQRPARNVLAPLKWVFAQIFKTRAP